MKQLVKRQTLTGNWTEFSFAMASKKFIVKNFTDADIFVSFKNNDNENESIKIAKGMGEEIAVTFKAINKSEFLKNSIYVKGTGEVEVQALDAYGED